MKRALPLLLALAVLLLLLPATVAAADTEIAVIAPEDAPEEGEEFTVTVEISGNPGLNTFQTTLLYDSTELECVEIEMGPVLENMMSADNPYAKAVGGAIIAAASLSSQNEDGILAVFHFRVLTEGAVVPRELTEMTLGDENGQNCPFTLVQYAQDGTVIVMPVKEDEPEAPPEDEPEAPAKDEPEAPAKDEPEAPAKDEPEAPAENEPEAPAEDEPEAPAKDEPETPAKDEPEAPAEGGTEEPAEEAPASAFPDVAGHWGERYIGKAAALGLFTGFEDGTFHPDEAVTRAQFVTVMWRLAGKPAAEEKAPFADVPEGQWFSEAVAWAYARGLVNGRSEEVFDPNGSITRQEAMKILFAYQGGVSGMEAMFTDLYDSSFSDSDQIAAWAKPAIYWCYYNGIINGKNTSVSVG